MTFVIFSVHWFTVAKLKVNIMPKNSLKLVACLLNILEAKNYDKVEKIAWAPATNIPIWQYPNVHKRSTNQRTSQQNFSSQHICWYNRSVITIAGKLLNPHLGSSINDVTLIFLCNKKSLALHFMFLGDFFSFLNSSRNSRWGSERCDSGLSRSL